MIYKYIEFVSNPKVSNVWVCRNRKSGAILGGCEWYESWRDFMFSAEESAVFSADYLRDIADALGKMKKE